MSVAQSLESKFRTVELRQANQQTSHGTLFHVYPFAVIIKSDWNIRRECERSNKVQQLLLYITHMQVRSFNPPLTAYFQTPSTDVTVTFHSLQHNITSAINALRASATSCHITG